MELPRKGRDFASLLWYPSMRLKLLSYLVINYTFLRHFCSSMFAGGSGGSEGPGWAHLLGASGGSGAAAGSPPGRGDVLPEDQELRQTHLPLSHHRKPDQAAQDDEDRWEAEHEMWWFSLGVCVSLKSINLYPTISVCSWDQEGHERSLPGGALPGWCEWEGPHPEELWTEWVQVFPLSHIHSFLSLFCNLNGFIMINETITCIHKPWCSPPHCIAGRSFYGISSDIFKVPLQLSHRIFPTINAVFVLLIIFTHLVIIFKPPPQSHFVDVLWKLQQSTLYNIV